MSGAAVPKATIDKNGNALLMKNEIWCAQQRLMTTPSNDLVLPQKPNKLQFGVAIPASTDTRHYVRALFLCEYVWHRHASERNPRLSASSKIFTP